MALFTSDDMAQAAITFTEAIRKIYLNAPPKSRRKIRIPLTENQALNLIQQMPRKKKKRAKKMFKAGKLNTFRVKL